jgi:phosphatidylglycerol---prolipoprotein diacylglyceryl transferase
VLPVLFTIGVPAGWGPPLALLLVALVAGVRTWATVRAGRARRTEARPLSPWEALRADGWLLAGLVAAAAGAWRAGLLDGRLELPLHTYGLLMAAAFLAGVVLAQREARRRGQDPERIADLAFWILLAALLGSQVLYVALNLEEFTGARWLADPPFERLPRLLVFWRIGLVFYGGFIGAALAAFLYMRRHRMSFLAHADTLIPSVAFGHFLGRLGCFSAGCCWGGLAEPHLPWAVRFPEGSSAYQAFAGGGYPPGFLSADHLATAPLHPVQLYEAFGELGLFLLLVLWIRPRKRFHGEVLAAWLLAYAVLRGALEAFRGDLARHAVLGLNSGQWISVAILAAGALLWLRAPRPVTAPV